jgi:hypothetical protein
VRMQSSQVKFVPSEIIWIPQFNTMYWHGTMVSSEKIMIASNEQIERGKVWKQPHMKWELTYNIKFRNTPSMNHAWFPFDVMVRYHPRPAFIINT